MVTLVGASTPVWMLLIGRLFFKVAVTRRQVLGALLSISGVVLVLGRGDWEVLAQLRLVPGDLYVLLASVAWAFYSWLLARPPASMSGTQRPDWDWAGFLLIQALFGVAAWADRLLGPHGEATAAQVFAAPRLVPLDAVLEKTQISRHTRWSGGEKWDVVEEGKYIRRFKAEHIPAPARYAISWVASSQINRARRALI